jgi:5-methylcytosine-specific restriction endonuclease McrA
MNKVYDWKLIGKYAKDHTVRECREKFGFASQAWTDAVNRGDISPRSTTKPINEVATKNSTYPRSCLKRQIIKNKLIPYACKCGNIGEWQGQKLVLQLEHKNGVHNDHRLDNLEFLCPNCHSQTKTFTARNRPYK